MARTSPVASDALSAAGVPNQPQSLLVSRLAILGLSAAVALLALAARWPNALLIPAFTDETDQITFALRVARGEILPLTHNNTYMGIVYPYLLAALFKVFGPSAAVARGMMVAAGVLLAGGVTWLAWAMARVVWADSAGGRSIRPSPAAPVLLASLTASCLTATSFPLTVLNSHVAWSNDLTPLFTTLALGATWHAVLHERPWRLVASGVVWGLALQTHPSALGPLLGVVVWALLQPVGRAWLRTRWAWLAVGGVLLGYANMIVYNVLYAGRSLADVSDPRRTFVPAAGVGDYLARLGSVAAQLGRMLAGAYTPFDGDSVAASVTPVVALFALLGLAALVWGARRRTTAILPLAALTTALVFPLLTNGFTSLYSSRYLAPALVLVYVAMGLTAVELAAHARRAWMRPALAAVVVLLIIWPLAAINAFYVESQARGLTNEPFLAIAAAAREAAAQGGLVLVDKSFDDVKLGGGGTSSRAILLLLTLDDTPYQAAPVDKMRYFLANSQAPVFLVLGEKVAADLSAGFPLTPIQLGAPSYRVYTSPAAK